MTTVFRDLDRFSERVAVIDECGVSLSYRRLLEQADAVCGGMAPRSLTLIACGNTVGCLAGYLGVLRAGGIPILLHRTATSDHIADVVRRFRPQYFYAPDLDDAYVMRRIDVREGKEQPHTDLALLLPTSGTTGSRQFVRLSSRNLMSNAAAIIDYLGITQHDRPMTTMPMNYAYGLSILHSHLIAGATIVMTEQPLVSQTFWQIMRDQKVTTFGGVPFIFDMLRKLRFDQMDLPNLRYVTQAGGKLSKSQTAFFLDVANDKSRPFFTMYGQTEATSRIAYLPYTDARAKIGSIGQGIPGVNLSLADAERRPVAGSGQPGELVCRGANVSMGYAANSEDLKRNDDNNGTLYTGDIAQRDEDGFYYIVGRKKRFIKLFGHRINLDEVESVLRGVGHDCACTGCDDRLSVFTAGDAAADLVKLDITRLMGLHQQSVKVVHVGIIPRSESGKVDYHQLESSLS